MNFDVDPDTEELRRVVRRLGATLGDLAPEQQWAALDELGALDVLGPASADPAQAQVQAVVVLEELAAAGLEAPVAETMWARAVSTTDLAGFIGAPTAQEHLGTRLVPYGARIAGVAVALPGAAVVVQPAATVRPAHVIVNAGHAWVEVPDGALSFAEAAGAFAWRAGAAQTMGALDNGLRRAVVHARNRVQFGKPIASFQALQFRLAESLWRLKGLRLAVLEAAWRADQGDARAEPLSAMAWLLAAETSRRVTRHVHQVFAAIGFSDELGLTRLTGATAFLRASLPAAPAAAAVMTARRPSDHAQPPSTVLAGFAGGAPR